MAFLRRLPLFLLLLIPIPPVARGQARFDLTGPKIDVHVTRRGISLPISSVPNLQPGDQLWLHPDLPPSQSVHYLLIVAFLRGTTNPPPDTWFTRVETWQKRVVEEGVIVTVPPEAQQALLFLAPETGGDFSTLRSAVKGRPGIFVRASQDLTEAGFEQARTDKYLEEMKKVPAGENAALLEHSNLLARTLNLKPNPECFKRPVDQQYTCLTQTGTQTLLDDGHAESIVSALSNGPGSDFINQASYTQLAGAGTYSAYVGAIVDFVRIVNSLHTAKYQYIPAIAEPENDALNLRLNTPPSFNNPKSVIVISLPAVAPAALPPLRPVDARQISCLLDPSVAIPVEGAPLVFSTTFVHDLRLHLDMPGGPKQTDLPLIPDAFVGGLTLGPKLPERHELPLNPPAPVPVALPGETAKANTPSAPVSKPAAPTLPGQPIRATIQGMWGFDPFTGPTVTVQQQPGSDWRIVNSPSTPGDAPVTLIAGQPNHLELLSTGTACVQSITLEPSEAKVEWKLEGSRPSAFLFAAKSTPSPATGARTDPAVKKPAESVSAPALKPGEPVAVDPVDLTLNLQHAATPGSIHLAIQQFGSSKPDQLGTRTFAEPARIQALQLHAGDTSATLTGTSLDQVKTLTVGDLTFTPSPTSESGRLNLSVAANAKALNFKADQKLTAQAHLEDGRTLDIASVVLAPRPSVSYLSSRVASLGSPAAPSPIQISTSADLPLGDQLLFFLKSRAAFTRAEKVEIASLDDSLQTALTVAAGSLVLQDAHTVLATFDPLKTFGPSTFGPFHMRAVDPAGTPGEWLPLTTIVRLPTLTELHCPAVTTAPCALEGAALYLIDAVSPDPGFASPTSVPEGFVEPSLAMPRPALNGATATFYLKLRDDPATPHQVTLPVQLDPASPSKQKAPSPPPPGPSASLKHTHLALAPGR